MIINYILFLLFFSIVILTIYHLINLIVIYYNKLLNKEGFTEEEDQRCKKEGQVFSDFPPGVYCSGPGKIKIE